MSPSSRGSAVARIEVDPDVLVRAGQRLTAVGTQLGLIADLTKPMLANGIASGWDLPGMNFALEYSATAGTLATGLADAANGCKAIGLKVQASGHNYQNADAASTIPGGAPMGSVGEAPPETSATSVPAWPNGIVVTPPGAWAAIYPVVQLLGGLGMTWPLGDPTFMRVLAVQWDVIASGAKAFNDDIDAIKTVVSMQDIPERDRMLEDVQKADDHLDELATYAADLARRIRDFAQEVENAQNAIRRILARLSSLDSIVDTITGLFSGEAEEIARDIVDVLANSQRQVKAVVGLLEKVKQAINDALTEFQKLHREVLVATFGDDVGNALATTFDYYSDFEVGILNGVINTVSGTVAMLDADTWKGMYDVATMVADDPSKLDDVLLNMGKEFIAYDAWSGDHPGRAAGEAAFNIASLVNPYGGALSKTGTLAKGFRYGSRLASEGRLPRLSDLPGLDRRTPTVHEPPGAGRGLPDTTPFTPGRIPDSLTPGTPGRFDPPETPSRLGGQPHSPGPHSTPGDGGSGGGDDPPSGGGGRPVGPPDSTPGQPGHSPSSPGSPPGSTHPSEPSAPATPSHSPSTGDTTPHTGENRTSPSTHDGGVPKSAEPEGTQHEIGNAHPDANHSPAEHQSANGSTPDHPGAHERPASDGQTRDQPGAPHDTTREHQSASTATGVVSAMPMGGHTGGTQAPSPSPSPPSAPPVPSARAPSVDGPTRSLDTRSAEPRAAGPEPGRSPAAPVTPAATPPVSSGIGEPLRPAEGPRDAASSPSDRPGDQPDPNEGSLSANQHGPLGNPANDRIYGPRELDALEDPSYQTDVENALQDADGNTLVHADPRTNDYGQLINDGGPDVPGRGNNCLDCSLSALSSFHGDPTVSAPRWPDTVDGVIDRESGERSGLRRAADWIGGEMLAFQGRSVMAQYHAIHQYLSDLGPGSAALIHNGWHAFDRDTNSFLYHVDGTPETRGSHATVVVYPEGASGPVWWDPQQGIVSDHPPSWMTGQSTFVNFSPVEPTQGAHYGGVGNQGTGTGIPSGDVPQRDVSRASDPERMGVHEGVEPRANGRGPEPRPSASGDRFGDGDHLRVPELVGDDGGRGVHGVQTDGSQPRGPSDLSVPVGDHDPADPRGPGDHRVPADGELTERSTGTDPDLSPDNQQTHIREDSEERADGHRDVLRGVEEPPGQRGVAGDGHDSGVGDEPPNPRNSDQILGELRPWDVERVERAIDPEGVQRDLLANNAPFDIAASALDNPYAGMTPREIIERYWDADANTWNWPPHSGFRDGEYRTAGAFPEDLMIDQLVNEGYLRRVPREP